MNISAEFEQEKDGRWVATIPGIRELAGYGSTRYEAAVGLTVRALRVMADRVESGQLKVEAEPGGNFISFTSGELGVITAMLDAGHIPNAETIAAIEELESGGGETASTIEELFAKLNADD